MECKQYLRLLCLVAVVLDTMGKELRNGNCLYSMNETLPEKTFNQTTQICCSKSGVHDKYNLGQEVKCCGETTYKPEIELCRNEKVYYRPDAERIGKGNYSHDTHDTSSEEKSMSRSPSKKRGNPIFRHDVLQNTKKQQKGAATTCTRINQNQYPYSYRSAP